jgi:hypothetical protein
VKTVHRKTSFDDQEAKPPHASTFRKKLVAAICIGLAALNTLSAEQMSEFLVSAVSARNPESRINAASPYDDLIIPTCNQPAAGVKLIGWGKTGIHFMVPKKGFQIQGGKPDVDYVRYVIKPTDGKSYLQLWFGGMALSAEPRAQLLAESIDSSHRNLKSEEGQVVGKDNRRRGRDGAKWRQTAVVAASGAIYESAELNDARLFDKIVDSICEVPFDKK